MTELNAEQRLRDDAIVRGIIAQAQREAAQVVLNAVEAGDLRSTGGAYQALAAARAAAARYGAGAAAGGDGR